MKNDNGPNFCLRITPAIEAGGGYKEFLFYSLEELNAAKETCAVMLLFMQDRLKIMHDYSNSFVSEKRINDGEWVELED